MNIRPKDAKAIFLQAIEKKNSTERNSFLNEACRGDLVLQRRVTELLRSFDEAGGFMEDKPGAMLLPEVTDKPVIEGLATVIGPTSEGPGTVIGPYKMLQQIGEGGFGTVYMAEQAKPVRRQVALKIIKPGMDTKDVIARFETERQALALMDHPNVAKVLDAGTTDSGRPYFVMELVHGVSITEFCDRNNLTARQRLEMFVDVCNAVQHAHQKGIIHRDIKPSNIMVTLHDGKPVPKVIDFGVAKATSQKLTERRSLPPTAKWSVLPST